MAKIVRKTQKVFADVSPSNKLAEFGSLAQGAAAYSNDPDNIQTSEYGSGWAAALINNAPPAIQDLDGLCYLLSRQLAYILQNGIPEWNASETYYIGDLVSNGTDTIYISVADDNTNNALSTESKWCLYKSSKIKLDTSNFYFIAYDDNIVEFDGSTAGGSFPVLIIFPAPSTANTGRVVYIKNLVPTASGGLQIQVFGGSNIDGAGQVVLDTQYQYRAFKSTGTAWEQIN